MTPEKILEILRRYDIGHHDMGTDALLSFAQAIIEAERESSDEPVGYVWESHFMDTGKAIKLFLETPEFPPGVVSDLPIVPVYKHPPPARKLTDEEILDAVNSADFKSMVTADDYIYVIARAVERRINGEEE